jgi:tetratricopeptide (TPR) repeat protein
MQQAKNAKEYIANLRAALASNSECGASHYNLAVALLGIKEYEEAENELQAAIDCSPNLAEAFVQLGGLCLQRGDLDGCLEYNKHATKVRAGFCEGYANIGFVQLQMGKVDDAIASLQKAIVYNSKFVQAYATLANAYLMKGLVKESIITNLKALKLVPTFAIAHNNLAIAYLENKEYDLAVKHCDKAIDLGYEVAPEILKQIETHR